MTPLLLVRTLTGMATSDEQRMREQFEAPRLPPDEWSQEVRDRLFKWDGRNYLNGKIDSEWHGFQDGYRARDAEVQALKEALEWIVTNSKWWRHPDDGLCRPAVTVWETVATVARAALARAEGGAE